MGEMVSKISTMIWKLLTFYVVGLSIIRSYFLVYTESSLNKKTTHHSESSTMENVFKYHQSNFSKTDEIRTLYFKQNLEGSILNILHIIGFEGF